MDATDFDRITAGESTDPHRSLGPHREDGRLIVRAFRPEALSIVVRPDDPNLKPRVMARVHPGGIFQVAFEGVEGPFPYRLEVRSSRGTTIGRDAYAFPPSLVEGEFDPAGEGALRELPRRLGAHVGEVQGVLGTAFAVWAPAARRVSVVGDFNRWDGKRHAMRRTKHGVWEIFVPDVRAGATYKYEIKTASGLVLMKSDPVAFSAELRPSHASKVAERSFVFTDKDWLAARRLADPHVRPMSIYEVHLGSWRRKRAPGKGDGPGAWLSYRELADELVDYVVSLGFTHVELLPVMEHPFDGSWGYQVTGYFAATSRFGHPDDLRYFVDRCHARGLGVLLDWPPAHFPKDAFALGRFDGEPLYEHADPRRGEHREWRTFVFDYGKKEVRNFLIASALYWLDEFHVDGLRVDAVASMLYLDYGAKHPDEWEPNEFGGRENLDAVRFLRELSDAVHHDFPGAVLCAEESTTWPGVTRPTYVGGLGFDFKWNMGWMHDTLDYFALDPIFRAFHHTKITFGLMYAFSERFLLPLSHDEVVHLKRALLSKMPGDRWKQHANLRALYAMMWAHPGKKLVFMGGELGQWREWNHDRALDWELLGEEDHAGLSRLLRDLNGIYRKYEALWELDESPAGFTWIDANDAIQSVASFVRFPRQPDGSEEPCPKRIQKGIFVVFVGNFTPLPRYGYRVGVPRRCRYIEVLNTDARVYGGSGVGNLGSVDCEEVPSHGFEQSIVLTVPPLAGVFLVPELEEDPVEVGVEAEAGAEAEAG
ncbi:1,4-alpha-glucan branching protein GlgB [Polyangium jinanense]|uniref:1,4-alpha-glucan branching enzyme GlgB n=1 Tax=Polyangium jinanense TaxID=2829994 RepID=A0A9X4AQG5_9BACT|nr:1,4-alpha-glucan branching protein GlgB [Polyangium jinanense]MDC3955152.1 1,4-alpha-glucan branching protein GlgB [Polyangium jinanense]MDC3981079.1 1,4-alpha-glucan branching protein GlgB [Polyangium jinanense]